jgi:release factor glutamine methyltransferase
MKIKEALLFGAKRLKEVTLRPRLEAEILLSEVLKRGREFLIINDNLELSKEDLERFKELIKRRESFEPIEYITNRVSFWDFELYIDERALIPRPETEILVEKALNLVDRFNLKRVAEVGIGSGAISIAIAKSRDVKIEASDISQDAIEVAKINIKKFNLEDKIVVKECSLLDCLNTPQLLISNPPYISRDFKLDKNILDYEPHTALFADDNGAKILFQLLDEIKKRGIKFAICEMGYDQKEIIKEYASRLNLKLEFYKDLANLDRGFICYN